MFRSLMFSLLVASTTAQAVNESLPQRIILGVGQASRRQVWILEEADSYYIKLGPQAQPLRQAFPHVPYPLAFIEFHLPKGGNCPTIFECEGQAPDFRIQAINISQGVFPAIVRYKVTSNQDRVSLDVEVTNAADTTKKASLRLEFPKDDTRIE